MANGMAAKMPPSEARVSVSLPAQPPAAKVIHREDRRDDVHEHQQLADRQDRHEQLERGGDADPDDVERREDRIGAERRRLGIERGILHRQIGTDRQRDGGGREDELDQRGEPGDRAADGTEGAVGIGERTARLRDRRGQFGKGEDEGDVHRRDDRGGDQEAQRPRRRPAIAPPEIFARNDEADGDAP